MLATALRAGGGAVVALIVAACSHADADSPQAITDGTTRAVYADDVTAMQAHFDDALRQQVTLDQVASMSNRLHQFGEYHGLTPAGGAPADGRYDFSAAFDHATMTVHVRFDQGGQIGAYHIDIPHNMSS